MYHVYFCLYHVQKNTINQKVWHVTTKRLKKVFTDPDLGRGRRPHWRMTGPERIRLKAAMASL
jgi:hypothetical protein